MANVKANENLANANEHLEGYLLEIFAIFQRKYANSF